MPSDGAGTLFIIKFIVNTAIYREISEHFMLPSAGKLYGDAKFSFPAVLCTCPQWQHNEKLVCWTCYYCVCSLPTGMTWTTQIIYGLWWREKWETPDPTIQMGWRLLSKHPGLPALQQCHRLIDFMLRCIDTVIGAKAALTEYWVHKWSYFSKCWHFCIQNSFLIGLMYYSNILEYWVFLFSWAVIHNHQYWT